MKQMTTKNGWKRKVVWRWESVHVAMIMFPNTATRYIDKKKFLKEIGFWFSFLDVSLSGFGVSVILDS
jgi:hypothetical protein